MRVITICNLAYFYLFVLPETEDIITLYDNKSNNDSFKYCYMQCNVVFCHVKHCVLKIILNALFEFKSKDKYEKKMLNRLKRSFKRKVYINSFWLMSQVLYFLGSGR